LPHTTLNLGILAHVDAGKTTLSERLLHAAGAITEIGRVDHGTTVTDSMELERQRGITIRSAVAALSIGDTSINLIDTPGHPDFVAEVDRVLGVLDGAVLVISAVEGVQPQTRVLMRALRRLHVPTLLFVNKIDRRGADDAKVMAQIERHLDLTAVPMVRVEEPGTHDAQVHPAEDPQFRIRLIEALADHDELLLQTYVNHEASLTPARLRTELATQARRALVYPVFAGSALTGAGMPELMDGLVELLPRATGDADDPVSGSIFKIERGTASEKIAYARMFSGTLRIRDRLNDSGDKINAIRVFDRGAWVRSESLDANQIGTLWGLAHSQVGDAIGRSPTGGLVSRYFDLPTLETVVEPVRHEDHVVLRSALSQLAEQDPLIDVRTDNDNHELAVSLYGEVQKEVLQSTLASDYGLEVRFRETTPLYLERPIRIGEAIEFLNSDRNPFRATVGLRIAPAPAGSGISFALQVDYRSVPLFVYRTMEEFGTAMEQYVRDTLREGLYGWAVSDCTVTMTSSTYSSPDGPPATRGSLSRAADFRKLTPMVVMQALADAGTAVHAPMSRVAIEAPAASLGPVLGALGTLAADIGAHSLRDEEVTIDALLESVRVQELHRLLPRLTSGEGTMDSHPAGYRKVHGDPPSRQRITVNPLNREEYVASVRTS
jgi:ribosomal protection tetracycline resistance protein